MHNKIVGIILLRETSYLLKDTNRSLFTVKIFDILVIYGISIGQPRNVKCTLFRLCHKYSVFSAHIHYLLLLYFRKY